MTEPKKCFRDLDELRTHISEAIAAHGHFVPRNAHANTIQVFLAGGGLYTIKIERTVI